MAGWGSNRRNLSVFTRTELALKLKPLVEEKARANQAAAGAAHVGNQHTRKPVEACQISDNLPSPSPQLAVPAPRLNVAPSGAVQTAWGGTAAAVPQAMAPRPVVAPRPAIVPVDTLQVVAKAAGVVEVWCREEG